MTEQATVQLYIEEKRFNDYNNGEVVPAYATEAKAYTTGRTVQLTVPTKHAMYIGDNKELQGRLSSSHVSYAICENRNTLLLYLL